MKKILLAVMFAVSFASTARAGTTWHTTEKQDELTDAVGYNSIGVSDDNPAGKVYLMIDW
jgi:hypothetical protein